MGYGCHAASVLSYGSIRRLWDERVLRESRRAIATVVVELLRCPSYCTDSAPGEACGTAGGQRRPAKATCVAADMAAAKVSAVPDSASAASRSRPHQLTKPYKRSAC